MFQKNVFLKAEINHILLGVHFCCPAPSRWTRGYTEETCDIFAQGRQWEMYATRIEDIVSYHIGVLQLLDRLLT